MKAYKYNFQVYVCVCGFRSEQLKMAKSKMAAENTWLVEVHNFSVKTYVFYMKVSS